MQDNQHQQLSPVHIAPKRAQISLALPGAERNLTRLKAPATATPIPKFPFTIRITTQTIAGRSIKEDLKVLV